MTFRHKKAKHQGEDDRPFDTTSLRLNQHGALVHRDYAAHFFRWGFATRFIKPKSNVLDIGCGPDQALVRILTATGKQPKKLTAVDYDDIKARWNIAWFELRAPFDFTKRWKELTKGGPYDVITCFEVIEHMQKASGRKLLRGARELLADGGKFLLSTPVYDGKRMAQNHIHEYGIDELAKEITAAGLAIERRFGTFQTALQAKACDNPIHRTTWDHLRAYYSDDVLACFLAPLYPDQSRNNLWVLGKP